MSRSKTSVRGERGGVGVFIGGLVLREGLGFARGIASNGGGDVMLEPDSSQRLEMTDRWAPPISVLPLHGGYRFGSAGLAGLGRLFGWAESAPPAFSSFSYFSFSFLFSNESFGIQKCLDLNNFKSARFF
jgi:hypothetical protein